MIKAQAIHAMYPEVVRTNGDVAYDAQGNEFNYNPAEVQAYIDAHAYKEQRARAYPPITDYLDGIVKGDQAQIDKYISDCQAVKAQFPKP